MGGGKGKSDSKPARNDSGFGGSECTNQAEMEEPFGSMEELTDAVFDDMFSPGTSKISSKHPLPSKRNETPTNPFLRWRKAEALTGETEKKMEPVTEL